MKKLFVIFCCSLLNFQNLTAQAIERSFSAGYHSFARILKPYGEDKWLIEGVSSGFNVSNSFYHIPDTEDFFAFGYPTFQLWHKSGSSTFPKYTMVNSLHLPNYFFYHKLVEGSDGWFYFYRESEKQFERINYELQHEVLFKLDLLNGFIDYSLSGSNLIYSIHSGTGIYKINQYNIPSKVQSDLLSGGPNRIPWRIATKNGWLALAGVDILRNLSATPEWARCSAAWLNVFPITDPSVVEALPNASINEIEQTYALDTAGVNYFSQGYFYNISGGGFKVKLTNSGQLVIDQVNVNVAFRQNNFVGFCFTHSTEQKRFSNLNLPPGESIWLDFGDIQARGQVAVPAEICFWTSSPNDQPDADSEDDFACITSSYTVAVKEPDFPQASLSPNPANAFVDISFSKKMEGEKWQLFDAIGRLLQFGDSPEGQVLRLETKHLANGIYLIRFESTMLKLVVQH